MSWTSGDRAVAGVIWARVEDGFHVGSRDGDFLGYIDQQPSGRFLACDTFSRPVGLFDDLPAAMYAVTNPDDARRGGAL